MIVLPSLAYSIYKTLQDHLILSPKEKNIGKKPVLGYAPKGIEPKFFKTPLDHPQDTIKEEYGLDYVDDNWMNYWTLGKYENLFSDKLLRFDEHSSYEQVWVGCYMIKRGKDRMLGYRDGKPCFEDLKKFPEADQATWLNAFGVTRPAFKTYDVEEIDPLHAKSEASYFYKIDTDSDVNLNGMEAFWNAILAGSRRKNPHPKGVTLYTLMTVWREGDLMIMPYACCTKENWEKEGSIIEQELRDMMASIKIKDLRYMLNISNIGQRLSDWIVRKSILKEQ